LQAIVAIFSYSFNKNLIFGKKIYEKKNCLPRKKYSSHKKEKKAKNSVLK